MEGERARVRLAARRRSWPRSRWARSNASDLHEGAEAWASFKAVELDSALPDERPTSASCEAAARVPFRE